MSLKRVDPDEAARLQQEGWTYLDVRSVAEFDEGHPAGAFNVPFMHRTAGAMTRNAEFEAVVANAFSRDARLLVGCKTGNRSQRACQAMAALGYTELVDVRGGFSGEIDPLGQVTCPGWQARALPTATHAEPGRSWAELARK